MQYIFIYSILLTFILFSIIFYKNKNRKNNKLKRITMIDWMKMTDEERKSLNKDQMIKTMNRKKSLLKNIRKEYKRIKDC